MSSTLSFNLPFEFFTSSILLIYKSSDFVLWILKKHGMSCFKIAKIPFHPSENTILVILVFPPCRVSVYSKLFFFHLVAWFSVFTSDFPGCLIILGGHQSSWELMGTSGQCWSWLYSKRSQRTSDVTVLSLVAHSQSHLESWVSCLEDEDLEIRFSEPRRNGARVCYFSLWYIYADYTCCFQSNIPTHVHLMFSSHTLLTLLSLGNKLLVFSIGRRRGSRPVVPNG